MACASLPKSLPSSLSNRGQSETFAALLARASTSDTRAFAELHALVRARLRRIALASGAAPHDVDDILQESLLKIWRNAGRFDSARAPAMAWMSTIVRNTTIDYLRSRRPPGVDLDEALLVFQGNQQSSADEFDYDAVEPIARGALARLPEERRELVTLAYLEGESRASLSVRFGVPVGTVKTWLHRTVLTMREDCLATMAAA